MKTFKTFMLITALVISSVASASIEKGENSVGTVSDQISTLLQNPNFDIPAEVVVNVDIMLNENNEMVVLSVNSNDKMIDGFIKNRLNYKTISISKVKRGEHIVVPVRFKAQK